MHIIADLIKKIYGLEETKKLDIDSKEAILVHRDIIEKKDFLKKVYLLYYDVVREVLKRCPKNGQFLEIGSGPGFLKKIIPNVITSDIKEQVGFDIVFDAQEMPFRDKTLSLIFMLDVLHHLNNVENFFREAQRCLVKSGRIVMIEPYVSKLSRFIYKHLHHESFKENQQDWTLDSKGFKPGGNIALPSIVFFRDRRLFIERFPKLKLLSLRPYTIFLYHISGGFYTKSFVPLFMFKPICKFEQLISPFDKYLASMFITEIVKVQ